MRRRIPFRGRAGLAAIAVGLAATSAALAVPLTGFVPGPRSPIEAGVVPRGIVAADFDGDGDRDLAVANMGSAGQQGPDSTASSVSILLGDGAGGFRRAANLAAGLGPYRIAAADFDGDGDLDLAVTNYFSDNVSILLGGAGGSFGAATNLAVGDGPLGIVAADFNDDGDPDLAVANSNSLDVSILLGGAGGSFGAATNFRIGYVPIELVAADFDADGDLDLATANEVGRAPADVSILLGDAGGGFAAATHFVAGDLSFAIATADFDGDGDTDLAVANCNSDDVSILLGGPGGSFGPATNLAGGGCEGIAAADLDGDGDPDLAVSGGDNVSILLGEAGGGFGAPTNFAVGGRPHSVAVADLDGDGDLDLAVARSFGDNVSILLNIVATPPSAPRNVSATPGNGQAIVDFLLPGSDGGLPITSFMVAASPGGQTASGARSPIIIGGLSNRTRYTFTVTATNAAGTGPGSTSSNAVTPAVPDRRAPRAPRSLSGRFSRDGVLRLTWAAARDNVAVTGYEVRRGKATVATVRGLRTRIQRRLLNSKGPTMLTVLARDAAGNRSASSNALTIVPRARPAAAPTRIPAWVWRLLRWHATPAAERGSRPAAVPPRVPDWYWSWAAWRRLPFVITS